MISHRWVIHLKEQSHLNKLDTRGKGCLLEVGHILGEQRRLHNIQIVQQEVYPANNSKAIHQNSDIDSNLSMSLKLDMITVMNL